MIIGIPKETLPGERRVALVPTVIPPLAKAGHTFLMEAGAGNEAGFPDAAYAEKKVEMVSRGDVFSRADLIAQVRGIGSAPGNAADSADLARLRPDQTLIAMLDPLGQPAGVRALAERRVTAFAMELMPRITRAQSMDVLSSMATIAGYKAVLLAATSLPRMFPMMVTAAGTLSPARVLVMGVGVAGLQAIATARRLGAVVEAYDVRPAVKEQVQSVGAKFLELALDTAAAEDKGGYAKALGEDFYRKQRELLGKELVRFDAVITTAAVPGKRAPILVTREMVAQMNPGSVLVDLAAATGGNCELTRPDETVFANGVTILGPTNLPATVPHHASQMYAKNVATFLAHLAKDGTLKLDLTDEITRETLVARGGEVVNPRVREALGLPALAPAPATSAAPAAS
jgi:H+-translocating NAD(P) transhydrogenase subunit alpha